MATTLSQQASEEWTLGLLTAANRSRIIALRANADPVAGAARYSTLRQFRTTAGYQVPTGFEFLISRVIFSGLAGASWALVDGTNDVGLNSAAAPAGMVRIDDPYAAADNGLICTVSLVVYPLDYYATIPADRFPALVASNASNGVGLTVLGVERAV